MYTATATSLPAVLNDPGGVGEPVPGESDSVVRIYRGRHCLCHIYKL